MWLVSREGERSLTSFKKGDTRSKDMNGRLNGPHMGQA